jgi:hypothetical protein
MGEILEPRLLTGWPRPESKFDVPEVWIVDLKGAAIEVYLERKGDAYAVKSG